MTGGGRRRSTEVPADGADETTGFGTVCAGGRGTRWSRRFYRRNEVLKVAAVEIQRGAAEEADGGGRSQGEMRRVWEQMWCRW